MGSTGAHASVFGETVAVSPIGVRLSVEIASPGMTRDALASCVRLPASSSDDGIATLRGGSLGLAGAGANARIVVTHPDPVFEPILRLTLQDVCSTRLQRTYTLLMPEPVDVARSAPREASRPAPRPASPPQARAPIAGAQVWTTVQGESVSSIAQAMYPRDEGARRAFVNGVISGNPAVFGAGRHPAAVLPPGTELRIPSLAGVASASSQARMAERERASAPTPAAAPLTPARPEPVAPTAPAAAAAVVAERDRLMVDTGARDELASGAIVPGVTDESVREERLVAAIDRSIDAQLELLERIRRLEELQVALRTQIEATTAEQPIAIQPLAQVAPATQPSPPPTRVTADERIPEREGPAPTATRQTSNWLNWAIAGGILALALLLLLRRRSTDTSTVRTERPARAPTTEAWPNEAPVGTGVDRSREVDTSPKSEHTLPPPAAPVLEWETPATRTDAQPVDEVSSDMPTLPPSITVDEEPEEHESAVELADIMLSFGRVQGAAETLEAFIESNPNQAIMPWLKLMEVYHKADMQHEFGILATELNKTFNVQAVTWENFRDFRAHGKGIDSLTHIMARLQETWGTKQCQAYIDLLVRDNRQGTRLGFELGALDDLLMLAGVLEQQLGRYKRQ